MLFTVLSYVVAAVHVLLPPYLLYQLWCTRFRTVGAWLIEAGFTAAALAVLYLFGRWDVVGVPLRYGIGATGFLGALLSVVRVYDRPFATDEGIRWRWGALIEGALFVGLLIWGGAGYWPGRSTVDLAAPLHGETYYVAHGGGTPPLNYHGAASTSQRYALDVNQLNGWGLRADGLRPDSLPEYAIYGDTAYSPMSGRVVEAVDSLRDQRWPDEAQPAVGNHVWLRRGSLYVVLAHLKQGSVRVEAGERVEAGDPLAQVGHTGNTTEPHLHLHAVRGPAGAASSPDSLADGSPVPVTIGGRFLTRNDMLPPR
jgi:hypothetical protein